RRLGGDGDRPAADRARGVLDGHGDELCTRPRPGPPGPGGDPRLLGLHPDPRALAARPGRTPRGAGLRGPGRPRPGDLGGFRPPGGRSARGGRDRRRLPRVGRRPPDRARGDPGGRRLAGRDARLLRPATSVEAGFVEVEHDRTIVFGRGAIARAGDLLGAGFTLLCTSRSRASAPEVVELAGSVIDVPGGWVDEIAATLRPAVSGEPLVALGGGRVIDV